MYRKHMDSLSSLSRSIVHRCLHQPAKLEITNFIAGACIYIHVLTNILLSYTSSWTGIPSPRTSWKKTMTTGSLCSMSKWLRWRASASLSWKKTVFRVKWFYHRPRRCKIFSYEIREWKSLTCEILIIYALSYHAWILLRNRFIHRFLVMIWHVMIL